MGKQRRLVFIWRLSLGITCLTTGFLLPAQAKEPAALVIEIAQISDEMFPPTGDLVALHSGRVHLDKSLWPQAGKRAKNLYLEPGLKYLEDVSRIVFSRRQDDNFIWLAKDKLPSPSLVTKTINTSLPFKRWKIDSDYNLILYEKTGKKLISQGESLCLSSTKSGCVLYLHNYGIKTIGFGSLRPSRVTVNINDSFSGHFSGPGGYQDFSIPLPQPGMLVVEYNSSTGTGSIDIAIYNEKKEKIGEGGAYFKDLSTAKVTLTYRGIGEAGYDAGFLFIPDNPLACSVGIEKKKDGSFEATLTLKNNGTDPFEVLRLDTGTVSWYAKGKLIAAAHPARLPQKEFLAPEEELIYHEQLLFPKGTKNIEARIDLPNKPQDLRCRAEF